MRSHQLSILYRTAIIMNLSRSLGEQEVVAYQINESAIIIDGDPERGHQP